MKECQGEAKTVPSDPGKEAEVQELYSLRYARLIISHTGKLFVLLTVVLAGILGLTFHQNLFEQSEQNLRDYLVYNSPITHKLDIKNAAEKEISKTLRQSQGGQLESSSTLTRSVEMNTWNAVILYHQQSLGHPISSSIGLPHEANLWTSATLAAIKTIEEGILNIKEYRNFCPAFDPENGDFSCDPNSVFSVVSILEQNTQVKDVRDAT